MTAKKNVSLRRLKNCSETVRRKWSRKTRRRVTWVHPHTHPFPTPLRRALFFIINSRRRNKISNPTYVNAGECMHFY